MNFFGRRLKLVSDPGQRQSSRSMRIQPSPDEVERQNGGLAPRSQKEQPVATTKSRSSPGSGAMVVRQAEVDIEDKKPDQESSPNTSIFSAGMTVRDLVLDAPEDTVIVRGIVEGSINVKFLHIAPGGTVRGMVIAQDMWVEGVIDANVRVERVTVDRTGEMFGSTTYHQMILRKGGRVSAMLRSADHMVEQ